LNSWLGPHPRLDPTVEPLSDQVLTAKPVSSEGATRMNRWKHWARAIRRDAHALYLVSRDPRVPWYAKLVAIAVAAYALSPIDLIPDFIPVLGYLDDLIVIPLGIALVVRMIPPDLMAEHRRLADAAQHRPVSRAAAAIIVVVWFAALALTAWTAMRILSSEGAR
jgi:uncharacterized membrane protein YkvA (DUF1232 family)